MKKSENKTTKKSIIDKDLVFADAVKNSIRNHGILLEYETQKLFTDSLEENGFHIKDSKRSHCIPWQDSQQVTHTQEIDVFLETVLKLEFLDDIDKNGKAQKRIHRQALNVYFLAQCKGHDKEGFLLADSCEPPRSFKLPICQYEERYRDSPEVIEGYCKMHPDVCFVDWAYFYTGEYYDWDNKNKVTLARCISEYDKIQPYFKQSKAQNSNKFMSAIEQINESLDCFFGAGPLCNQLGMMQLIIPVIVTNADILIMKHSDKKVTVYKNIPWIVYMMKKNQKGQSPFSHIPVYDKIYVVNSTYISEFCNAIISFLMDIIEVQYGTGDKVLITEFDV